MEQTKVYEAHYPETLRRIFIINGMKMWMSILICFSVI